MSEIRIDAKFADLAKKQVTGLAKDPECYDQISRAEYNAIKDCIGKPHTILDLGCGLGRMSIYLGKQFEHEAKYILADANIVSENLNYGWKPGEEYYNDLTLTAEFCRINGLKNFKTFDILAGNLTDLQDVDLVMSFLSVGFHYPIEEYMDDLLKISTENCTMVFGIDKRRNIYDLNSFSEYFETRKIVPTEYNRKEQILILENRI